MVRVTPALTTLSLESRKDKTNENMKSGELESGGDSRSPVQQLDPFPAFYPDIFGGQFVTYM